ncbi:hypothetical protein G6F55_014155 [Rhizopus delemar]|uniref:Uncharacterized protein n=1 Tax=Rhizopus delemar TaxID=936053 RepID=A0A9P6XZ94_9FUNG|nr:hypothetical protein G6F55_014155 [Rhizopus delemar]KAG1535198.1 hypothetical protein G6F50_015367 [Rhizopus delemar]
MPALLPRLPVRLQPVATQACSARPSTGVRVRRAMRPAATPLPGMRWRPVKTSTGMPVPCGASSHGSGPEPATTAWYSTTPMRSCACSWPAAMPSAN